MGIGRVLCSRVCSGHKIAVKNKRTDRKSFPPNATEHQEWIECKIRLSNATDDKERIKRKICKRRENKLGFHPQSLACSS